MRRRARFLGLAAVAAAMSAAAGMARADTVSLTPSKDNTLYEDPTGSLSNGAGPGLFTGVQAAGQRLRTLLAFDLSAVPSGATITSASLTVNANKGHPGLPLRAYPVLQNWGEGASVATGGAGGGGAGGPAALGDATWLHTFYNTGFWTTPGGDFATTPSATVAPVFGPVTFSSPQLATDVQNWRSNPSTNFGWIILGDESSPGSAIRFDSRESFSSAVRPTLTLVYSVAAGPSTWNVDASGNWSSASNWSGAVPNSATAAATFGAAIHANRTVTVDGNFSTGGVTFDNAAASYTLAGPGSVAVSGPVTVSSGSHVIGASVALNGALSIAANASLKLVGPVSGHVTQLTIGNNGKLDLTSRGVTVDYAGGASPAAALRDLVAAAYHDGLWDGKGIASSAASVASGTTLGIVDSGSAVTVQYTLYGDTDLNGTVNQLDFNRLVAGLQAAAGTATWQQGDFNYDRVVNADDFSLFDLGAAIGTLPSPAVPEPASVLLLAFAPICIRRRACTARSSSRAPSLRRGHYTR